MAKSLVERLSRADDPVDDQTVEQWRQRLATAGDPPEFPSDRPRPAAIGSPCHRIRRSLTDLLQHAETPAANVIAAWAVYLTRASILSDRPGAVVVAEHCGDHRRGHLLNIDVGAHETAQSLVHDVAESRRAAKESGDFAFAALADAIGLADRADRNPLCSTAVGPTATDGVGVAPELTVPDLQLEWSGSDDGRIDTVEIVAAAALFDTERVELIADQFVMLLRSSVLEPDRDLRQLDWVPADELSLFESGQGTCSEPGDPLLGRRFSDLVPRCADRIAVSFAGTEWTYRDLDRWSNRLANDLRRRDVGPGTIVAIRMERSIELVGSLLAVLKAGGAYLPVDPTYPPARQQYMLDNASVSVILTDSGGTCTRGTPVVDVGDPLAEFHQAPDEPVEPRGDGSELGYVIFTSGSTGTPKAVGMPTRALANLLDWQLAQPEFEFGRRALQFSSPSFDVSFQEIMSTWLSGGTLVLIDDTVRRDSRGLYRHIVEHDVERLFLPNVALRGLAEVASAAGSVETLPLREVYTAGEQLRIDDVMRSLFERHADCRLINQYGPSETHVSTAHVLDKDVVGWPTLPPIGTPIANSVAEVLDPAGRRVPVGVPGELWLGGRCLALGYIGNPEATSERFVPDPFRPGETLYRTGDRVKWSTDGELEFLGRLDHQVKFRGFRIEPDEIATVLASVDGVANCFVTVRDIVGSGARLVAYVQPKGQSLDVRRLRRHAADTLPDYMVPTHFVRLDTIPLTSSGKVDIDAMPEPTFDRAVLETDVIEPRNPVEEAVQAMWQSLLGAEDIGVVDDFFELGGDSLLAVELFAMIHNRFGVDLPLGVLARRPTIEGVADQVTRAGVGADDFDVVVPIRTGGSRIPLFCVHGGSGNVASFPRLARLLDPDQPFYGLQWPGLRFGRFPRTLPALAERYVTEIRQVQPEGPYRLAGQCIGGLIAHDMARQLVEAGDEVDFVVLYDSPMLYSPAFRPLESLPAVPSPIRPLALRALSTIVGMVRFVKGRSPRGVTVANRIRRLLGARIPRRQLFDHASSVMCGLAWRHEPTNLGLLPTVLIHSGEENAGSMSLAGHWVDGVLGWQHRVGPHFEAHQVSGGHNDLLYSPDGVTVLRALLSE